MADEDYAEAEVDVVPDDEEPDANVEAHSIHFDARVVAVHVCQTADREETYHRGHHIGVAAHVLAPFGAGRRLVRVRVCVRYSYALLYMKLW